MATTIVTKYGSDAPAASNIVRGELAVDTENGRLYTENIAGAVVEIGLNPEGNVDVTGSVTADGLTVDGTGQITRLGLGVAAHASAALNITTSGTDQNIRLNNGSELGVIDLDSSGHLNIWAHGDGETINLKTGSGSGNNVVSVVGNNVGIGTTTPAASLEVEEAGTGSGLGGVISSTTTAGGNAGYRFATGGVNRFSLALIGSAGSESLRVYDSNNSAERLRIAADGLVSIKNTAAPTLRIENTDTSLTSNQTIGDIDFYQNDPSGGGVGVVSKIRSINDSSFQGEASLAFHTGNTSSLTERLRIDASGNLMVGLTTPITTASTTVDGVTFGKTYTWTHVSDGGGQYVQRQNDANFSTFYQGTTEVGSIGTRASGLVVGSGDTGLFYDGGGDRIFPESPSGGAARDAAIDLGTSAARFKDLYLSGRVIAHGVTTSAYAWSSQSDSTSSSIHLYFRNPNGFVGNISTSGTATAYNTSSDYRLKENVVAISGATERLKQLKPSRFNFITDADTTVDGFLAHEVADIVPEAITGTKDAVDADGNPEYQGIDQSKLVPLLVATIQELEARIAALES